MWANSPRSHGYERLWETALPLSLDLRHWVNDALMALFFLVVGLEIRRETTTGHLAGRRAAMLPVAAAVGGMVVPALVYLAVAGRSASHGWGIPMATDIALAVGTLALVGDRAPRSLRAFLLGLAVVDDIGAIVVIAVVYSDGVRVGWLLAATAAVVVAVVLRRTSVPWVAVLAVLGVVCWWSLLRAGVHPTLAGVVFGVLTPTASAPRIEHALHPVSSFGVVPLFALANAGVAVGVDALRDAWHSPIAWGVTLGLVIGKPVGVLVGARIAMASGATEAPEGVTGRQLLGAGNAAGIGFTVALFITELAFKGDADRIAAAKVAVLMASVLSGLVASVVLRRRNSRTR